jgi:hypothetical protein
MLYCFNQPLTPFRCLLLILMGTLIKLPSLSAAESRTERSFLAGYEVQLYRPGILPNPFSIVTVGAEYSRQDSESSSRLDLRMSFNPQNLKVWALRNPDARITWKIQPSVQFTLGRRMRRWNELDSSWNLSMVQPIDQWDRFRPEQQGLIGAFLDYDAGPVGIHLFATYLMYPENIPNVVIENGRFVSYHPQAISSTPQTITLLNQTTPLFYEIDYPNISDVVFRPGLMASIETPARSSLVFRLLYGWKPYNYFTYALRGVLSIPNNQVQISIKPRVNNHQVVAGDLGYRISGSPVHFGVSALADLPGPESLSSDYTYAPISNSMLVSPWVGWEQPGISIRASQLIWHGGTEPDVGPYANPGAAVISSHVFYRNATQITTSFGVPFLTERAKIDGRWVHDYEIGANSIGGDLSLPLKTSLGEIRLIAGGDLVQTTLDANPNRGGEMLIDLRTLDRFRMGVTLAL